MHNKLGIEGNFLSCIKNIYEKPTALVRVGNKTRTLAPANFVQHCKF